MTSPEAIYAAIIGDRPARLVALVRTADAPSKTGAVLGPGEVL
jgi:hypothetical protein